MSHVIWHCGLVGSRQPDVSVQWEAYWRMTCGYKLSANLPDKKRAKLARIIDRRIRNMAEIAGDCFEEHLPGVTEFHPDLTFAGDYKGFAYGPFAAVVPLDPFPVASDLVLTYSFFSVSMTHEVAAALEARLDIERYHCYLAVYEETGGLITPYTDHVEAEVDEP